VPSLFFGLLNNNGVPADENVVRRNTVPVIQDAPPAEMTSAPDFNEVATDSNPALGLEPRQLASHVIPSQKSAPFWIPEVNSQTEHNAVIDRQVSTSGTAAAREAAGQFGHGTLMVTEGIEPVQDLREGGKFGNEYFKREDRVVQEGSGNYMSVPPGSDQTTMAMVAATGKSAAQRAREAAAYAAFLGATGA
jgi:hypothetical protein